MRQSFYRRRRFLLDKAVMSVRMQKWAAIIQEAATCGMTKTEYCARKGIDRRQFFHWQKVIREYILEHNPELGLPPPHGEMHEIRAANSQIMPSLPVFCELKVREEQPPAPAVHKDGPPLSTEAMIQLGEYRIYVGGSTTERTLSTILKVIRNA